MVKQETNQRGRWSHRESPWPDPLRTRAMRMRTRVALLLAECSFRYQCVASAHRCARENTNLHRDIKLRSAIRSLFQSRVIARDLSARAHRRSCARRRLVVLTKYFVSGGRSSTASPKTYAWTKRSRGGGGAPLSGRGSHEPPWRAAHASDTRNRRTCTWPHGIARRYMPDDTKRQPGSRLS